MKLREKIEFYLKERKLRVKENSFNNLKSSINSVFKLCPELLEKEIETFFSEDILYFREKMLENCYGESMIYRMMLILKKIFKDAFEDKEIDSNIFKKIKVSKKWRYKPITIITPQEFKILYNTLEKNIRCNSKFYKKQNLLLLELLFRTGLRHSEARALKWKNINFEDKTLTVTNSICCINNNIYKLIEPKTRTSARTIKLDEILLEELKKYKLESSFNNVENFVFSTKEGGAYGIGFGKYFLNQAKKYGVKTVSTHGLRHSHATMLMRAGVNPQIIQYRLGHSSVAITLNIYTHLTPQDEDSVINVLNDM